jgi:hypothetical protein
VPCTALGFEALRLASYATRVLSSTPLHLEQPLGACVSAFVGEFFLNTRKVRLNSIILYLEDHSTYCLKPCHGDASMGATF